MNKVTQSLFGGVLIGASLCSSASADMVGPAEINWVHTAQAAAVAPFGMYNTFTGPGNFNVSDSSPVGFALAIADESALRMEAQSDLVSGASSRGGSPDIATATISSIFTVNQGTTVTVSWNFRELAGSYFSLSGSNGSFDAMGPSGSVQLNLIGDSVYNLFAQVTDTGSMYSSFTGDGSFISMTVNPTVVPLPPAAFAGLGMLAGLGAYRRIRK